MYNLIDVLGNTLKYYSVCSKLGIITYRKFSNLVGHVYERCNCTQKYSNKEYKCKAEG